MPRYEPSGTESQIVSRLLRGDSLSAIREELGCGFGRIRRIAKVHRVAISEPASRRVPGANTIRRIGRYGATCVLPQIRLALLAGWDEVEITYPDDDDGVITIRRVSNG